MFLLLQTKWSFIQTLVKVTQFLILFSSLIVVRLEIKTARRGLDFINAVFLLDTGKATKSVHFLSKVGVTKERINMLAPWQYSKEWLAEDGKIELAITH